VLRLFVPDLAQINLEVDPRPALLAKYLAECFSTHAAATWLLEHQPADFTAVYYRAIDWVGHHFMQYHPPRMEGIPEKDAVLYGEVVNGIYRLHDRMLGRLLQLAGEETTVVLVSDDGFYHNHLRPRQTSSVVAGIAAWHRPIGIVTKVISMLLPSLPCRHRFRVIFMQRDSGEVAASQEKMLRRLSEQPSVDRA
jgi:hypothetical protein